jgi:hypothetical protein
MGLDNNGLTKVRKAESESNKKSSQTPPSTLESSRSNSFVERPHKANVQIASLICNHGKESWLSLIVDATLKEMVPLKCHKPEEANHRTSEFLSKLQSNDM